MVGDDLRVVAANRQVCPTISEITFGNLSSADSRRRLRFRGSTRESSRGNLSPRGTSGEREELTENGRPALPGTGLLLQRPAGEVRLLKFPAQPVVDGLTSPLLAQAGRNHRQFGLQLGLVHRLPGQQMHDHSESAVARHFKAARLARSQGKGEVLQQTQVNAALPLLGQRMRAEWKRRQLV